MERERQEIFAGIRIENAEGMCYNADSVAAACVREKAAAIREDLVYGTQRQQDREELDDGVCR